MTTEVIVAYIGGGVTIFASLLTVIANIAVAVIAANAQIRQAEIAAASKAGPVLTDQYGRAIPGGSGGKKAGRGKLILKNLDVKDLWQSVLAVFAFCAVLTVIVFLAVQHTERQKVKDALANPPAFNSPEYHAKAGDVFAGQGEFASATVEYRQAVEGKDSEAAYHDKLAQSLAKEGKLEEARKENVAAISLAELQNAAPEELALYHNNMGVTLYEMGVREYRAGNRQGRKRYWENAVEEYQVAVEKDKDTAEYHANLGRMLNMNDIGRYADALEETEKAVRLEPENAAYRTSYAGAFLLIGNYEAAQEQVAQAVEDDSSYARAYNVWGLALDFLGRYEDAVAVYRQALPLEMEDYTKAVIHNNLGSAYYSLGRAREALAEMEAALELGPYDALRYYNAAVYLVSLGRYGEALERVEQAIQWEPDEPSYHYLRAALLRYFNRKDEADEALRTAYHLGGLELPEELAEESDPPRSSV